MSFWTLDNLRHTTGGRWLQRPAEHPLSMPVEGLSIDTRTMHRRQAYLALLGEKHDGHDFLDAAVDAGTALLIVQQETLTDAVRKSGVAVLYVQDTQAALTRLASAYRRTLSATVVAITGSAGKTTTRQMMNAVLSQKLRGRASIKSYNNHIGVPLTILAAQPRDQYLLVEVGTSGPGEISALGQIVQPNIAVITHVGRAHLEKLGDLAGVAREKASLLRHLEPRGLAVVNGDLPLLEPYLKPLERLIRFGRGDHCDLRLTDYKPLADGGCRFAVNGRVAFDVPFIGEHMARNALAVIAIARHFALTDEQIDAGLNHIKPEPMRLSVQTLGRPPRTIRLINDAYNANPDSMAAAIEVLAGCATEGRRIAILGDMLELGDGSERMHRELAERIREALVDVAILIGPAMQHTAAALREADADMHVDALPDWQNDLPQRVAALLQPGDTVLLKASRGGRLERLIPAIEQAAEAATNPQC